MSGVNKVILVGHLGGDPTIRHTESGTPVVNFTLATSERFTDRNGERQERTEWHRVVAWAKLAEICNEYLRKGRQVYIEGRLQTRSWDKDGEKRYTTEVVAQNMVMLGRADGAKSESAETPPEPSPQPTDDSDDLPF